MIHVPTAAGLHYAGDAAAWISAYLGARWVYAYRRGSVEALARQTAPSYFVSMALGAAAGAWAIGSLNTLQSKIPVLSHSVAGALAGGIVAVELWKWIHGVKASTGGPFVIPLTLGIVIGREVAGFLAGLLILADHAVDQRLEAGFALRGAERAAVFHLYRIGKLDAALKLGREIGYDLARAFPDLPAKNGSLDGQPAGGP